MTPSVKASEVDDYIASGRQPKNFPPAIEALFQDHKRSYRARAMRAGILPAILFYNAFIPAHFLLLPSTVWIALALHALVTTWIVVAGLIFRVEPPRLVREIVGVSIPSLMIAQILTIYVLNASPAAADYQYLAIMIVVYMNVNVRPDFRFALGTSIVLGCIYDCVLFAGSAPLSGKLVGAASMASAVYLTLTANWRMDRDARHTFVRRLQDQLRRAQAETEAGRDSLTGLSNRRQLNERAARLWSAAGNSDSVAAIMLDVDHFKAFNDRYGHPAGDMALKQVAGAIGAELRDDADIAARFGGEEFLVLLPNADVPSAVRIAERIRRAVEGLAIPHEGVGPSKRITASLGVMVGAASAHTPSELIAGADTALYAAKRSGRNQVWPPFVARNTPVAGIAGRTGSVGAA